MSRNLFSLPYSTGHPINEAIPAFFKTGGYSFSIFPQSLKNNGKGWLLNLSIILLLAGFFACRPKQREANETGKLRILATTGMIADAAKNIGGPYTDVVTLMGPGVDPHLYKASLRDLNKLTDADLILFNGLHLEGKMAGLLEKLERHKHVVAVSDGVPRSSLHASGDFGGAYDPHIWFSVKIWMQAAAEAGKAIEKADPAHKEYYIAHTKAYLNRLDSLDREVTLRMATVPKERRVLITAHDAFGYFGEAYHTEVKGLQGISTVSEYGLRDVSGLVNFIIERDIRAIFPESSVSPRALEAVVAGCKARGKTIRLGGTLYSDAMGANNTPEGTYEGMIRANVKTITSALD
ncbi:MAG: zinc ABC transporter substrate-binding protein [Bacteroidota bacterium]